MSFYTVTKEHPVHEHLSHVIYMIVVHSTENVQIHIRKTMKMNCAQTEK